MKRVLTFQSNYSDHVCMCAIAARGAITAELFPGGSNLRGRYAGFDPGGLVDPAALVVIQKNNPRMDAANNKKAFRFVLKRTFYAARKPKKKKFSKHILSLWRTDR